MLKKEGLDVSHFASSVRLKKVLDRIGLPEEKLESLLEEISVHSLQSGSVNLSLLSKILNFVCKFTSNLFNKITLF